MKAINKMRSSQQQQDANLNFEYSSGGNLSSSSLLHGKPPLSTSQSTKRSLPISPDFHTHQMAKSSMTPRDRLATNNPPDSSRSKDRKSPRNGSHELTQKRGQIDKRQSIPARSFGNSAAAHLANVLREPKSLSPRDGVDKKPSSSAHGVRKGGSRDHNHSHQGTLNLQELLAMTRKAKTASTGAVFNDMNDRLNKTGHVRGAKSKKSAKPSILTSISAEFQPMKAEFTTMTMTTRNRSKPLAKSPKHFSPPKTATAAANAIVSSLSSASGANLAKLFRRVGTGSSKTSINPRPADGIPQLSSRQAEEKKQSLGGGSNATETPGRKMQYSAKRTTTATTNSSNTKKGSPRPHQLTISIEASDIEVHSSDVQTRPMTTTATAASDLFKTATNALKSSSIHETPTSSYLRHTPREAAKPSKGQTQLPNSAAAAALLQNFVTKVNRGDLAIATPASARGAKTNDTAIVKGNTKNAIGKVGSPLVTMSKPVKSNLEKPANYFSTRSGNFPPFAKAKQAPVAVEKAKSPVAVRSEQIILSPRSMLLPFKLPETGELYYMTRLKHFTKDPVDGEYFNQLYREHFIQTFQAMSFCRLLKPVDARVLQQKRVTLPTPEYLKQRKTIVFDLDETLIHCNESPEDPSDLIVPIKFPQGDTIEAGINVRPGAVEMLKELSQSFEIIVFTASHSCYANVVLDRLDPQHTLIHHRFFRDQCVQTEEGIYIKDLRVFGNRDLANVIIVDNAAYSFGYQIDNGIPIIPFYNNHEDNELQLLTTYLKSLEFIDDVREANRQMFKLSNYQDIPTPEAVFGMLFPDVVGPDMDSSE